MPSIICTRTSPCPGFAIVNETGAYTVEWDGPTATLRLWDESGSSILQELSSPVGFAYPDEASDSLVDAFHMHLPDRGISGELEEVVSAARAALEDCRS